MGIIIVFVSCDKGQIRRTNSTNHHEDIIVKILGSSTISAVAFYIVLEMQDHCGRTQLRVDISPLALPVLGSLVCTVGNFSRLGSKYGDRKVVTVAVVNMLFFVSFLHIFMMVGL